MTVNLIVRIKLFADIRRLIRRGWRTIITIMVLFILELINVTAANILFCVINRLTVFFKSGILLS